MDKEQLQRRITEVGEEEAQRIAKANAARDHADRNRVAASELSARADEVVSNFRDFIMVGAPKEVLNPPVDQYGDHQQKHDKAKTEPAKIEVNLGTYTDDTLGTGNAKATVQLIGAPRQENGLTPYGSLPHATAVYIGFELVLGDGSTEWHVTLGGEKFDAGHIREGIYTGEGGGVRENVLPDAQERVHKMEVTAARTLAYLDECARDSALNPELAARFQALAPLAEAA